MKLVRPILSGIMRQLSEIHQITMLKIKAYKYIQGEMRREYNKLVLKK
jgi:hypothetical protein